MTPPPISTRPATLFPYTTLVRSPPVRGQLRRLSRGECRRQSRLSQPRRRRLAVGRLRRCDRTHDRGGHQQPGEHGHPHQSDDGVRPRSEEHTSELQSLMRISYAVFCLTKKNTKKIILHTEV